MCSQLESWAGHTAYNKRASNLLRLIEADSGARDGTQFILIPWLFCFCWLFFSVSVYKYFTYIYICVHHLLA